MRNNPELPELPDDEHYQGETYQNVPSETQRRLSSDIPTSTNAYGTRPYDNAQIPPAPQRQRAAPPPQQRAVRKKNRGKARERRKRGYAPPFWAVALMLLFVVVAVGAIVVAVIALGGNKAPEEPPQIVVSSPIPTERPSSFPAAPSTATIPPDVDPNVIGGSNDIAPTQPLALSGPTLEPVVFTPTPRNVTVGARVIVNDVGTDQLNVREAPGVIDVAVEFRAEEGTEFIVVDGPRQADGLTWWQIQAPDNPAQTGWAASNYLILPPDDAATP